MCPSPVGTWALPGTVTSSPDKLRDWAVTWLCHLPSVLWGLQRPAASTRAEVPCWRGCQGGKMFV